MPRGLPPTLMTTYCPHATQYRLFPTIEQSRSETSPPLGAHGENTTNVASNTI